ncbi:TetR family transcriptional regulator [Peptoniphilus sp. AGMB00490]|uniref:TetR family transcriptional regulator n=1 Tax=Peptoniphilus faecalis TaxID=2731255 RepID=A0A848RGJ5_9FIRM|nr:TetR family transcriptional regulator [Peptoniphilus faecalis]
MAKQYTKNLIKREFLKLLEEKSFSGITISMLSERCEINRNTFYYHYEDIYTLVKEILSDELEKVDEEFNETFSWEKSLIHASSFLMENKKAAQNLFKSIEKSDRDNYLYQVCESVMEKYVENKCKSKNIYAKKRDKRLVTDFYRAALVGLLDNWIQDGMKESPEDMIYRIGKLFDGNIERSLRISEDLDEV